MSINSRQKAPQPFLKWAGGKRSVLPEILPLIPSFPGKYIEPFVGAGAVFFSLDEQIPKVANDFNADLIEVYEVIRDHPSALVKELATHVNNQDHFLKIRAWDRASNFRSLSPIVRAARFIYLNKTCFNGLYRVNRDGYFNVPFGKQENPEFIAKENLVAVSEFLNVQSRDGSRATFLSGDYREATALAEPGDFIYFDPPYDPISTSSSFVAYQKTGFTRTNQQELRDEAIRLTNLGIPILLSNSDTEFIRQTYADSKIFEIKPILVTRAISASSSSRGKIGELLITNQPGLKKRRPR